MSVPSNGAHLYLPCVELTHTLTCRHTCQSVTSHQQLNSWSAFLKFCHKISYKEFSEKFQFSENWYSEKNTGLLYQRRKWNLVPFCTFFVRIIHNFIQDMPRRTHSVTFRDYWCNERHALLKGVKQFLPYFHTYCQIRVKFGITDLHKCWLNFRVFRGDWRRQVLSFVVGVKGTYPCIFSVCGKTVWHSIRHRQAAVTSVTCDTHEVTICRLVHCNYWSSTQVIYRDHTPALYRYAAQFVLLCSGQICM